MKPTTFRYRHHLERLPAFANTTSRTIPSIRQSKPLAWFSFRASSDLPLGTRRIHSERHGLRVASNLPMQVDLLERYRALVKLGHISYDEKQIRAIMKLRRLQKDLHDYAPPALSASLLKSRDIEEPDPEKPWWLFSNEEFALDKTGKALVTVKGHAEELAALDTPKGLLLTGPPGSGKSFLVDLWFQSVPTRYKARKHYNQLVLEIYRGVWEETRRRMSAIYDTPKPIAEERGPWNRSVREYFQGLMKTGTMSARWRRYNAGFTGGGDPPIAFMVAKRLLLCHWLLVFDEVQLLDVSSANLLADVLSWYWRMGGVIVGTSNKVPDELYRNGVQRERLEPFVEALKARCPVTILDAEKDWREVSSVAHPLERTWFTRDRRTQYDDAIQRASPSPSDIGTTSQDLCVFGRTVHIPWASGGLCHFTFADLCNQSLGAADYLTIASNYPIVAISDIPILPLSSKDQARRFISLIDALYESKCRIICLAETTPDKLFFPDTLSSTISDDIDMIAAESVAETQDIYRPNVSSYDTPQMREAPSAPKLALSIDMLSIFSGEEEQFAFKRALSRLVEMTSAAYNRIDRWTPLPLDSRKWETPLAPTMSSSGTAVVHDLSRPDRGIARDSGDFAEEASYKETNTVFKRPHAPQLRSEHVWGVREDWGSNANDWGKGAKAYSRKDDMGSKASSKSTPDK